MIMAECFNNQFMYQEGFKAWVRNYKNKKVLIGKSIQARHMSQKAKRREFMGRWITASWRPLQKFESARRILAIQDKIKTRVCFNNWFQEILKLEQLDHKLEDYDRNHSLVVKHKVFSILGDHAYNKLAKR
jgi:hypothetical protein